MDRETRRRLLREIDLYPVIGERHAAGRASLEVLEAAIRGGATIVQLREKERSAREIYHLAVAFRERTGAAGILLIINDRVDIALAAGADGVHLGQDDLPLEAARALAPELLIGVSTHSREEALRAEKEGADYVNIGPIFPTATKEDAPRFLGPEAIPEIGAGLTVPFTVMGGINEGNLDQVLAHGARRVAMVTGVTGAPDITARVQALRSRIHAFHGRAAHGA